MDGSSASYDPASDLELARLLVEEGLEMKFCPDQLTISKDQLQNFLATLKGDVLKRHGDQKGTMLIKQYEKEIRGKFS